MVKIYTIQIAVAHRLALTQDSRYLDTTVKSGDGAFAPTWKIVMGVKEGSMSQKEYTQQYYEMMDRSTEKIRNG